MFSAVILIGLTVLALKYFTRQPAWAVLWCFHLVALLPMTGFTEHPHFTSDRYGLTVGVEWAIVLAAGLLKLAERPAPRLFALAAGGALLLGEASLSMKQVPVWRNDVTLFGRMISELKPDGPFYHRNLLRLGIYSVAAKDYRMAISYLEGELPVQPEARPLIHAQLGIAYASLGDAERAARHYQEAIRGDPEDNESRQNPGPPAVPAGQTPRSAQRARRSPAPRPAQRGHSKPVEPGCGKNGQTLNLPCPCPFNRRKKMRRA